MAAGLLFASDDQKQGSAGELAELIYPGKADLGGLEKSELGHAPRITER
jgi:hypothetical protein